MSSKEFEELVDSIPSDQESVVSDEGEIDSDDENELMPYRQNIIGDEDPENISPNMNYMNYAAAAGSENQDFSSDDELPLACFSNAWTNNIPAEPVIEFSNPTGPANIPDNVNVPYEVFLCLFPEDLLEKITFETNLYAIQKSGGGTEFLPVTKTEMKSFLGINILMGIKQLPSLKDYWSANDELRDNYISSKMSRNRFMAILGNFHVNNNIHQPQKGEPGYDKLYKIRPLLNRLQDTFSYYYQPTENQSIDESMIRFKGRSSIRQYMPQKPIKRGYKVWVRANESGYVSQFDIYTGKVGNTIEKNLGARVVTDLSRILAGSYSKVYFDNYFTSLALMQDLKKAKIYACGTVRKDRKGLPSDFRPDKDMSRGEFDWRTNRENITALKWKDKKGIHFISNFHNPQDVTSVNRRQKDGTLQEVACPQLVKDYNSHMGYVDKADMLKSCYEINRKSKKWYMRIVWHFVDVAIVNSFIIFCQRGEGNALSLKHFKLAVARGLIGLENTRKRGRKSVEPTASKFKRHVPLETRLTDASHMPIHGTSRRCGLCSTKQEPHRSFWQCSICNVALCLNDKKNCFALYHKK